MAVLNATSRADRAVGEGPPDVPDVLIVEDDPASLDALKRLVRGSRGDAVEIRTATNRDDALEQLHRRLPRVLLTDIQLPDGTGIEVLHELRHLEHDLSRKTTLAVAITARPEYLEGRSDEVAEFDALFTKPVNAGRLLYLLDPWLRDDARE